MNALDEAQTIAIQFNARHADVQLQVVQMTAILKPEEVLAKLDVLKGWLRASAVFYLVRGKKAVHAEAVHAGRLLSKLGAESRKDGPRTFYRLDNLTATSAD